MATITRPVAVEDENEEIQPQGSVPAPFPVLNPTRTRVNSVPVLSTSHQARADHSAAAVAREAGPLIVDAARPLRQLQSSGIHALVALLGTSHPALRETTLENSDHSGTGDGSQLRAQLHQLVVTLHPSSGREPEMSSIPSLEQTISELSAALTSAHARGLISTPDVSLAQNTVLLLSHIGTILGQPFVPAETFSSSTSSLIVDPLDALSELRQALARLFQSEALDVCSNLEPSHGDAISTVQTALASTHISDIGLSLLHDLTSRIEQMRSSHSHTHSHSQSQHSIRFSSDLEPPPSYEYDPPAYLSSADEYTSSSSKIRHVQSAPDLGRSLLMTPSTSTASNEKMRLEFDSMTDAIERLYTVSPQIPGQRVELDQQKRQEMELARIMGSVEKLGDRLNGQRAWGRAIPKSSSRQNLSAPLDKGKGRAKDAQGDEGDLMDFLEVLSQAQRPRLGNQRATVSTDLSSRLKKLESDRVREAGTPELFLSKLQRSVEKGRIQGQDAVLRAAVQNRQSLLTLPEFIHESRISLQSTSSPTVSPPQSTAATEETTPPLTPRTSITSMKGFSSPLKTKRSFFSRPRSHSVPAIQAMAKVEPVVESKLERKESSKQDEGSQQLSYVAEHQENLGLVSVLVSFPSPSPSSPSSPTVRLNQSPDKPICNSLILTLDSNSPTTYEITLPCFVSVNPTNPFGQIATKVQSDHLAIKILQPNASHRPPPSPLLDASSLNTLQPTGFICSSCSLAVVSCVTELTNEQLVFEDLPSEYWSEMVEAWMCHSEQKLSKEVVEKGKRGGGGKMGVTPGKILVGGSYLLVDESAVKGEKVRVAPSTKLQLDSRPLQCICGAALGSRQYEAGEPSSTYRFAKYAVRPNGASLPFVIFTLIVATVFTHTQTPPALIFIDRWTKNPPLSAYILADMLEIVAAHACYRFIIQDSEDEKVRMLIWLFNPSVRLSHSVSRAFALPGKSTSDVAKVCFKLVGPKESLPVEQIPVQYPDFAAAEYLCYPLSVCHSLAVLLQNSNFAYPPSLRAMGSLNLGWLPQA